MYFVGFTHEFSVVTGQVEILDLNDKVSDITQKIASLKFEVMSMMEDSYVTFNVLHQETIQLDGRVKELSSEMNQILTRVETQTKQGLQNSTGELERLSTSLQEATITMQLVRWLVDIDTVIKAAKQAQMQDCYFEAAKMLKSIGSLLEQCSDAELEIFDALTSEKALLEEHFLYDMMEIWHSCLKWEEVDPEKGLKKVILTVDKENTMKMEQMMQALNYFKHLDFYLRKFGNKVLKYLLEPLITQKSTVEIHEGNNLAIIKVESYASSPKPHYTVIFANIGDVFNFLYSHLNVVIEENVTLLNKLGEMISEEFCAFLIKNCLCDTIPSHSNDLEAYEVVAKATEDFQARLTEIGFISCSNQSILEYARNVNILFANKTCQLLLGRAREIMKKNLHDMMEIGPIIPSVELVKEESVDTKHFDILKPEIKLSNNTFQFPKCQISKSAHELLMLVCEVLDEAVRSTDFCAIRLFCTARNIFELYSAVIPTHHKKFLETIPQQVALFHNNCMYLAHRLVTLGHEYSSKFPAVLKSHTSTFIDQVTVLRELGTSTFLKFMQGQRKQILDILRNSGLATLGEDPNITPSIERAVQQCLRQLELLQTVWKDVLPAIVYCKTVGCLLNALVEELIIRVTTVEDVPATTAVHLVTVFSIVIDRAPQVFQEPSEVHQFVRRWQKFRELVLILGASLRDIDDRWADGKGPLAHEFTPDEVKQLIRALFQNTERRSAILARIK
ncbi:centromere/kinetochore protein zw10 homolog isoform X2 [Zootermopsis nevadensis]|uniref:centromere/kinetochore protein zw10 homolog isoform X2 n=1 Tax=Zootermopsis nevadensis TaxID=136037 RepID=UPI000B8E42FB|nr:centromere/kinetochore protein zw10 homolog isoform X2 [Zootermopsis nevadensis]